MKYNSEEMYIATLAQNEGKSIIYCGEILCAFRKNKVQDLLNEENSYFFLDFSRRHLADEGETYVIGASKISPKQYGDIDLSTEEELTSLANELNKGWTNIALPKDKSKVKR